MEPNKPKEGISFKPVNDGLGFHPFADGLPYAPVSKTPRQLRPSPKLSGSGAQTAGPIKYARSLPPIADGTKKTALQQQTLTAKAQSKAAETQKPALATQETLGFTYVLSRTVAYLLDTSINLSLCSAGMFAVLWKQIPKPEVLLHPSTLILMTLFLAFFNWSLIVAQEVATGTTLGKSLFDLEIEGTAETRLYRAILFIPSSLIFGLGVIQALFNRPRRCWHDVASGLQPRPIRPLL